jgi:hypothetical protein
MSNFGMAETDDGRTPKVGSSTNLDAKTFVLGHANIIGKSVIQEFFNCIGTLACEDAPILKETKNYAEVISALVLKLERRFICTHPTLQRLFYELPVIKDPRAKKIATLVLMNEFDNIVREAREIFDFYGMNHEKLVIDEILYNNDYLLRYLFHNDHIFDENIKKEVPTLNIIQQVFSSVNRQYSWIVAGNQEGFANGQLAKAKISMDDVFHITFEKPYDKSASLDKKKNDDNT